jgi:hypothetical protein
MKAFKVTVDTSAAVTLLDYLNIDDNFVFDELATQIDNNDWRTNSNIHHIVAEVADMVPKGHYRFKPPLPEVDNKGIIYLKWEDIRIELNYFDPFLNDLDTNLLWSIRISADRDISNHKIIQDGLFTALDGPLSKKTIEGHLSFVIMDTGSTVLDYICSELETEEKLNRNRK